nr:ankyrin repeat-containing protein ITN1-like [Quercus suber]
MVNLSTNVVENSRVLVAKFFTKRRINLEAIMRTLKILWRSRGTFDIRDLGNNIVMLLFDDEDDPNREAATMEDTWFDTTSFWVQIRGLHIRCMTRENAEAIGSTLGKVECIEESAKGIEHLYEMKLAHFLSRELLSQMKDQMLISNPQRRTTGGVFDAILRAIKEGIFEFVFEIVKAEPQYLWTHDKKSTSIFSVAVQYRHAKIFSLIYGLDMKNALTGSRDSSNKNNLLHVAGMSAASTSVNDIPGAALQMQRELQWFKEVESIVPPKVHAHLNKDGLTPRELFTENHKEMRKDGEQWMKDTATSCTVVGALIVTIMFAAVFTVPGGNNQNNGFPIFLNKKLFMVFIVSDALSLFSSSTSVLIFLGILTSRYAEEDFLESLPRKMIIGLSTLFFSIATMMTAFSAALFLMLHEQSWIFKPVICLASIPITLFVLMQFPLLVAMAISTYGASIFDRKMKRWF